MVIQTSWVRARVTPNAGVYWSSFLWSGGVDLKTRGVGSPATSGNDPKNCGKGGGVAAQPITANECAVDNPDSTSKTLRLSDSRA